MKKKSLFILFIIVFSFNAGAQKHFSPKQAEMWKVVAPRLNDIARFIETNQIDSCFKFFSPDMNRKSIKDSLIKAKSSISQLKEFSHNSTSFQEFDAKFKTSLTYVSKGFRFLFEIELSVDFGDKDFLFKSINLKDTKYFEQEYKNPNNVLPPTTPPPPPSNTLPPPPPK